MTQPQEFVIFAIGPVQSYIATARRTEDLWAGSRLLSELMAAGLGTISAAAAKHLFPLANTDGSWAENLPNRAVLLATPGQGTAVAQAMETAVRQKWQAVADEVKKYLKTEVIGSPAISGWEAIWDKQILGWLEVYWAVYPWDIGSYGDAYGRVSEWFDARKQLRYFPAHEEYDVKSTLGGIRQALRGDNEEWNARRFWEMVTQKAKLGNVRRGERLDAIGAIKRFAQEAGQITHPDYRFPSTSSIACADFRYALIAQETGSRVEKEVGEFVTALDKLVESFSSREQKRLRFRENSEPIARLHDAAQNNAVAKRLLRYDGDYFYPDFYTTNRFLEAVGREKDHPLSDNQQVFIRSAARSLRHLYEACHQAGIPSPSSYFAVLAVDGDHMGRHLSRPDMTQDKHSLFSHHLTEFAQRRVPDIVEKEFPGAVVYAGGDDVLALLPISCVLEAAEKLRLTFEEEMAKVGRVTASVGIALVHQQNPLQTAVELAQQAETEAKDLYGRQALAVRQVVRSGPPRHTGSKWQPVELETPFVEVVNALQNEFANGNLSAKFAYELLAEAPALSNVLAAHEAEIGRLLKRHGLKSPHDLAKKLATAAQGELDQPDGRSGLERLADWALVARFLGQGGQKT